MCLRPQLVKNPHRSLYCRSPTLHTVLDTKSDYIVVPCGRCPVCVALKQQYIVQRVQMESLDNFLFMGTLTYNKESLPSIRVNDFDIKYANVRHIQDMFRYVRLHENLLPFRYFAVSEFGGKRHRPHWHFILSYPKSSVPLIATHYLDHQLESLTEKLWPLFLKHWRVNLGSRKYPLWRDNCTFTAIGNRRNYDFSFVDTIHGDSDDVSYYVSKYVTKSSDYVDRLKSALYFNCDETQFKEIWSQVKPHRLYSKFFGDPKNQKVSDYIRNSIQISLSSGSVFPEYINPVTGKHFPLCPYYRKKFLNFNEEIEFKKRLLEYSPTGFIADARLHQDLSPSEVYQKESAFLKTSRWINARDSDTSLLFGEDDFNLSDLLLTDIDYGKTFRIPQSDQDFAESRQDFEYNCHISDIDDCPFF